MTKKIFITAILCLSIQTFASDHGIYLLTNKNIKSGIPEIQTKLTKAFQSAGYTIQFAGEIKTPDYVRQDKAEHCGFGASLIVLTKSDYTEMLTGFGTKYIVAAFLKIGIYETENGVNVNIVDPETVNRVVFNDLYENDREDVYNQVVLKTKEYKKAFVDLIHSTIESGKVSEPMPPIRDDEDLAESSKDMFMMVGPMTFFNDEDQFPVIYSAKGEGAEAVQKLKEKFIANLSKFRPTEEDAEYRWNPEQSDLLWRVISEETSPDGKAVLIGLTRPRTEAVSFNIAGSSRENDANLCPGIDHVTAYPIEVLLINDGSQIKVYTAREMFRMDMYFWDAGMPAFMNHMSMPEILDESIKRALLGSEYTD